MTPEELRQRIAELQTYADDVEVFHIREDELAIGVLRAVAAGSPHSAELAAVMADQMADESVTRWYA